MRISTERTSEKPLLLNACGIEYLGEVTIGSVRPVGRVDYHVLYIAEGECHLRLEKKVRTVSAGSIILFRPHEPQDYFFEKGCPSVSYYIHFTGRDCETILRDLGIPETTVFYMGRSKEFEAVFESMLLEYSMKKDAYEYACAAYLLRLLTIIARKRAYVKHEIDAENEKRINRAMALIAGGIDSEVSVADVAKACFLSEGHLSHLFKTMVGMPPYAYLTFLRLEKAKELLTYTHAPIAEIGASVGYRDQNYFSRFFKKQVGLSPSDYRKAFQ